MGLERKKDKIREQPERQSLSSTWLRRHHLDPSGRPRVCSVPHTTEVTGDVTFTSVTITDGWPSIDSSPGTACILPFVMLMLARKTLYLLIQVQYPDTNGNSLTNSLWEVLQTRQARNTHPEFCQNRICILLRMHWCTGLQREYAYRATFTITFFFNQRIFPLFHLFTYTTFPVSLCFLF